MRIVYQCKNLYLRFLNDISCWSYTYYFFLSHCLQFFMKIRTMWQPCVVKSSVWSRMEVLKKPWMSWTHTLNHWPGEMVTQGATPKHVERDPCETRDSVLSRHLLTYCYLYSSVLCAIIIITSHTNQGCLYTFLRPLNDLLHDIY